MGIGHLTTYPVLSVFVDQTRLYFIVPSFRLHFQNPLAVWCDLNASHHDYRLAAFWSRYIVIQLVMDHKTARLNRSWDEEPSCNIDGGNELIYLMLTRFPEWNLKIASMVGLLAIKSLTSRTTSLILHQLIIRPSKSNSEGLSSMINRIF